MKRFNSIVILILCMALVFSMSACGEVTPTPTDTTTPTTTEPTTTVEPTIEPTVTVTPTPTTTTGGSSGRLPEFPTITAPKVIAWDGLTPLTGSGDYAYAGDLLNGTVTASPTFAGDLFIGSEYSWTNPLTIDMQNAHVEFNGQADELTVITSASTFVSKENAIIQKLVINGGNAEVSGKIVEIEIPSTNMSTTSLTISLNPADVDNGEVLTKVKIDGGDSAKVTTTSNANPEITNNAVGAKVVAKEDSTPTVIATSTNTYVSDDTSDNGGVILSGSGNSSVTEGKDVILNNTQTEEIEKPQADKTEFLASELSVDTYNVAVGTTLVVDATLEGKTITNYGTLDFKLDDQTAYAGTIKNHGTINVYDEAGILFANQIGGEIKLMNDLTMTGASLYFGCYANSVYDLNGKTLNLTDGYGSYFSGATELTIKNGSLNHHGIWHETHPNGAVFAVPKDVSMNMYDVEFHTNGAAFYVNGDASEVNIINSSIYSPVYCVATNANTELNHNVTINISGSDFYDNNIELGLDRWGALLFINVPGYLNISDTTITSNHIGIVVRGGTANIDDVIINYTRVEELNEVWGTGNDLPSAGITIGNKYDETRLYQYPSNVTIGNVKVNNAPRSIYVEGMFSAGNNATVTLKENFALESDSLIEINGNVDFIVNNGASINNGTVENNGKITLVDDSKCNSKLIGTGDLIVISEGEEGLINALKPSYSTTNNVIIVASETIDNANLTTANGEVVLTTDLIIPEGVFVKFNNLTINEGVTLTVNGMYEYSSLTNNGTIVGDDFGDLDIV